MSGLSDGRQTSGLWLQRQRAAAGLTQEELAERSGLSVRAISNLENGRIRRPRPNSLRIIAEGLGLTEAALGELFVRYAAGPHGEQDAQDARPSRAAPRGERRRMADAPVIVPRQLPAAVASFAGRTAELGILDDWLVRAGNGPEPAVVISVISGMAGVGKTTLAVHWAHRVAETFPDGQLYVNLRGYDSGGQPADAAEVVREFLLALGVAPDRIPAALDGRTAMYRSVVAGRRVLVMADNAQDPAQVRPLLPGTPGSAVLVTSRDHLGGLAAAEGARILNLDVLTEADAIELLAVRLGPDRVDAEPAAVGELIRRCARLPLALAIVAAWADLTGWPLAVLLGQLTAAGERLGFPALGDPAADLRAVFSWSYRRLSAEQARMFRLLAVHPGPDISVPAAASLGREPAPRAHALLRELVAASMLSERGPGRFVMHDLLRGYASEQAGADQAGPERHAAVQAIHEHYLHAALAAARALEPAPPAAEPHGPGLAREEIRGYAEALAWFGAEREVLLAVMAQAVLTGSDDCARQLAWALVPYYVPRREWTEMAASQQVALECSERLADPAGQARAYLHLGRALASVDQAEAARAHLARAAELFQALGDRSAEARAHLGFSAVCPGGECDAAESIASCLRALELAEAAADTTLMAHACNNLGYGYAVQGDAERALAFCRRALDLCRQAGHQYLEAQASDSLGYVYGRLGDYRQAAASYRQAVGLFQAVGASYLTARSLSSLGDCQRDAGHVAAARAAWRQAWDILEDQGHPEAAQLRRKLAGLRAVP